MATFDQINLSDIQPNAEMLESDINTTDAGEIDIDGIKFEPSVEYNTKVGKFDGPLDLLLFLIKEAKIEIRDIFVSEVTEQYLAYINSMEQLDIEKASEYLSMAATLVELKSKALLPRDDEYFDYGEEYVDPQEDFFKQVEEYKMFKDASEKLKNIETTNIFYKQPDDNALDARVVYKDFNLDGLIKAFSNFLMKHDLDVKKNGDQKEIPKEHYTVRDKIQFIKERLAETGDCTFFELFERDTIRTEVITTFQALLELLKLQYLKVEQKDTYDNITIHLREDRSEELGEIDEYN